MQSLWGMARLGPSADPSVEAMIARLHAAGFDGAGLRCMERGFVARAVAELRARGLAWQAQCLPRGEAELEPLLDIAQEFGAAQVNVIAYLPAEADAVAVVARWLEQARARSLDLVLETHRGTITNTLRQTLALLQALPALRLTADLSHLVVAHSIKLPVAPEAAVMLDRILARSAALHLRIGTSEQVQVPVGWPQHAAWRAAFAGWWRRALDAGALLALVELGPPPFALTDADGAEVSDRWTDALALRDEIRSISAQHRETMT